MSSTSPSSESRRWLVLLASSPEQAENRLLKANMDGGHPYFNDLFVPYTMMGVRREGQESSKESYSLRSALRRYIFIDGSEKHLQHLMVDWNRMYVDKLFFLTLDKDTRTPARVSDSEKKRIEQACRELQNFPDLPMPSDGFRVGQKINLAGTPFEKLAGESEILEVMPRTTSGSVDVRMRVMMFGIPFDNFYISFSDTGNYGDYASRVATAQKKLLDIFCRRVNKKDTLASHQQDEATLKMIFEDSHLVYKEGAMKRHFLALMLICAHLKKDEEGVNRFTSAVLAELKTISNVRESKAATDTRAYLHIALFIATGDPKYRTLAKAYVSKYNPSSPYLRKFVTTMSKFSATSHVGPHARC